jgi:CO/xanthine dehydrogenase Mo-binding subunit
MTTRGTERGSDLDGLGAGRRVDRWLEIAPDGTVTVFTGKVEIGQGVRTALAQLVADELDVPFARVRVAPVNTARSPDEGWTAGSNSIQVGGLALRHVAAEARRALVARAAIRFGVSATELRVVDGVVRSPGGAALSYGELAGDGVLSIETVGDAALKPPSARRIIGRNVPRLDLEGKITGAPAFVHDLEPPGMLHARVLRPPSYGATLLELDEGELRSLPGVVAVVRDGSFVGLVATREDQAILALRRAARIAHWTERETLPDADPRALQGGASEQVVIAERDDGRRASIARTVSAEYSRPAIAHAALGPSCAVAQLSAGRLTIWTHSQGVHPLRREIAKVLALPDDDLEVIHVEGAGCYGHNGADDVALDAALLARAVGDRPVRVQWTREDEFAWEPFGPAMVVRVAADLDAAGEIVGWTHDLWSTGHGNRPSNSTDPGTASLLAARHLARPFAPTVRRAARSETEGANRNARPLYDFAKQSIVSHHVSPDRPRASALRSLGAHANVFAIESFIDEIAALTGEDPIALRLRRLGDPRARAVIEKVAATAGWRSNEKGDGAIGRGVGFARYKNEGCYAAVIAEVRLEQDVTVTRVWAAVDAGMAVSPDGVINQSEGGIVQAVSWALKEAVTFDRTRITSRGWDTYPILRFSEVPDVEVALIDRPDDPPLGVGEGFAGPMAGAIANAISNAAGVRVRDMPFTRERVRAAMGD